MVIQRDNKSFKTQLSSSVQYIHMQTCNMNFTSSVQYIHMQTCNMNFTRDYTYTCTKALYSMYMYMYIHIPLSYLYLLVRLAIGSLEVMCFSMWFSKARWSPLTTAASNSLYSKYFPLHIHHVQWCLK